MASLAESRKTAVLGDSTDVSQASQDLFGYMIKSNVGEGATAMTDEELVRKYFHYHYCTGFPHLIIDQ